MRILDSKFSVANDIIFKTSNGEPIPEDEPIFILRARDNLAIELLRSYDTLSRIAGCNDFHLNMLFQTREKFSTFARENPEKMKQPSITKGK